MVLYRTIDELSEATKIEDWPAAAVAFQKISDYLRGIPGFQLAQLDIASADVEQWEEPY